MRQLRIGDFGTAPGEDLLAYPGASPDTSFLYRDGELLALDSENPAREAAEWLESHGEAPLDSRFAVLCLGSNANPSQIHRKARTDSKPEATASRNAAARAPTMCP